MDSLRRYDPQGNCIHHCLLFVLRYLLNAFAHCEANEQDHSIQPYRKEGTINDTTGIEI